MKRPWRSQALRAVCIGVMAGVAFLASGDRVRATVPPGIGIDPFDVLDLQVKNNVLFIVDTSGSMKWPPDTDNFTLGDDDPGSRTFQARAAVNAVIQANRNSVNFGLATYNILDSQKTLNRTTDFDGDGIVDGPLIYVSRDVNAGQWLGTTTLPGAVTGTGGYFNGTSGTFTTYSPQTSAGIFASLMNTSPGSIAAGFGYSNAYPPGCTPGTTCRYYMQSKLYRSGQRYRWNRASGTRSAGLVSAAAITCPLPPAGLTGYNTDANGDGLDDQPRPCFQLQDNATGNIATYYYSSPIFQSNSGTSSCGGAAVLNTVAICSGDNSQVIASHLGAAAPTDATGNVIGFPTPVPAGAATNLTLGFNPPVAGLRTDQSTPLAGSLTAIRTAATPAFPASGATAQKNFVILVTDGDDTCASGNLDTAAVQAASAALALYQQGGFNPFTNTTSDFQHRAETMVIGFASAVSPARVNIIAQGGSGRNINTGASVPPLTNAYGTCNPGGACRDAFTAVNLQELIDALNNALQQAASAGEFSTTRSVFDAIPEYVSTVIPSPQPSQTPTPSPFDPMNPDNRYQASAFVSYQTTFEMPAFKGHAKAFISTSATPIWDAGAKLMQRLEAGGSSLVTVPATFAQLHGGLDLAKPSATARIDRRIFTNLRNGISPSPVLLWPPTSAVAPPINTVPPALDPAGSLDDVLGIGAASNPVLAIAQLQSTPFFACTGTPLPAGHPCLSATPAVKLARARHEAREMILAYTAGAQVVRASGGAPTRTAAGELQYLALPWLLAETALASPALVTPPQQTLPTVHTSEYILYRDGPRTTSGTAPATCVAQLFAPASECLYQGFGLRNPDKDGLENPPNTGGSSQTRKTLKPVMSVVYVAADDMLHAFRAGPCPPALTTCNVAPGDGVTGQETGGEELWGFVPYDLLNKLRLRMNVQTRDSHTFMIASGLRFAEVFVPSATPFTVEGVSYAGRWRRVLLFGRGLGSRNSFGKYYTALDITAPGPMTIASLDTQLPGVLWSRGNPDVNGVNLPTNNGSPTDKTLFADMGQTWSIPTIARVIAANNINGRTGTPTEFVVYTGSGYADDATYPGTSQGTRFYTLDAVTGDIVASANVGSGSAAPWTVSAQFPDFSNALVAPPAIYTRDQLIGGIHLANASGSLTTAAFIGDLHGRVWKFDSNSPGTAQLFKDLGRQQPIAVQAALLNLGQPYVFVGTGYDARVPEPSGHFQLMGIKDLGSLPGTTVSGFPISLPASVAGPGFRATVNPRTAFAGTNTGIALFVATRFNPAVASCISSFDTAIFAVNASNGNAVYDMNSGTAGLETFKVFQGVKAVGDVKGVFDSTRPPDQTNVDQGTPSTSGSPPPPAQTPPNQAGGPTPVSTTVVLPNSSVCR